MPLISVQSLYAVISSQWSKHVKNTHQHSSEISYYDPCRHNICIGVDDLSWLLCEGKEVSYGRGASQSHSRSTSANVRDSSFQTLFSRCLRGNTYFYVFVTLLGEMVRCVVETYFFHDRLCVGELSWHTLFRYSRISTLCYLLNLL